MIFGLGNGNEWFHKRVFHSHFYIDFLRRKKVVMDDRFYQCQFMAPNCEFLSSEKSFDEFR